MIRSARVSRYDKCCNNMSTIIMQLINLFDFALGGVLVSFTFYLYNKLGDDFMDVHTAWIGWSSGIIGLLLIFLSIISFISIASRGCRCFSSISDVLSVLIALSALVIGITAVELRDAFMGYLDNNYETLGLSNEDVDTIKSWFLVIAFGIFAEVLLQAIRICCNRGYADIATRMDREFVALLDEESREWDAKIEESEQDIATKYKYLREHYHQKYAKDKEVTSNSSKSSSKKGGSSIWGGKSAPR